MLKSHVEVAERAFQRNGKGDDTHTLIHIHVITTMFDIYTQVQYVVTHSAALFLRNVAHAAGPGSGRRRSKDSP